LIEGLEVRVVESDPRVTSSANGLPAGVEICVDLFRPACEGAS